MHAVEPGWVVFKGCRTRPLCGAALPECLNISLLCLTDFFSQPETFSTVKQHNARPLCHSPVRKHTQGTGAHTPLNHSPTNADMSPPSLSSTVCIKAVSNCTLSLIGSVVQCTAVDSDKSFSQSPKECLPAAVSEDAGGEKR